MIEEKMESMETCFFRLNPRIWESVKKTDMDALFLSLSEIKEPTIVTGVGGSSVVSAFFAKVLSEKNHSICTEMMPRDLLYRNLDGYRNIVACSYSGNNIGVKASFDNDRKHYLFSRNRKEGVLPLQYETEEEELSFVSIAATFIPMALLFLYYTDNDQQLLDRILKSEEMYMLDSNKNVYEIVYGYETGVAARLLESTIVEGSLGAVVLHEKYNYAHGRCQLNSVYANPLIYYCNQSEYDQLLKKEFCDFYQDKLIIEQKYEDPIVEDFYQSLQAMKFIKRLAQAKGRDISEKKVEDISEVLYRFQGKMAL